jgi:hypothetical protein
MTSILDHLDRLTRKERIVEKATREMTGGETWVFPVSLKKDAEYSFSACTKTGTNVKCSLFNGDKDTPLAESTGRKTYVSVKPKEDEIYSLTVAPELTDPGPQKVTVTVRKGYMPSRARVWYYPPVD